MKFHKATLLIMALALCLFSSTVPALSAAQAAPQTLNAEPIEGKPGCYHVAIRFREIESVSVLTLPEAESRGTKHESYELEKNEWEYDPVKSLLEIKRKIDPSLHIIRAKGKYQTPLRIIPSGPVDPGSIRMVIEGRIGLSGKDYRCNDRTGEIELDSCATGDEKYIIAYRQGDCGSSIGSCGTSELTRSLRRHMEWPLEGNTEKKDGRGLVFSAKDNHYSSVWMVMLLPVKEGYGGMDLRSGFSWDTGKNELTLEKPVDTEKFSVYILGCD